MARHVDLDSDHIGVGGSRRRACASRCSASSGIAMRGRRVQITAMWQRRPVQQTLTEARGADVGMAMAVTNQVVADVLLRAKVSVEEPRARPERTGQKTPDVDIACGRGCIPA